MFTTANLLKARPKSSILKLFPLLLLCLLLNSSCTFKLYELPVESAKKEEEYKNPKAPEVAEALKEKLSPAIEEKEEDKERLVRLDLEDFIDDGKEEGWEYIDDLDINIDGLLVSEKELPVCDWKTQKCTKNSSPDASLKSNPILSFIHLSDVQFHDERVYMFDKDLTKFFDKFVDSFAHEPDMVLYDYAYYLTLIRTINKMCNKLPEKREPKFMIHTGDAIDMGVVSELYEFIYITNKLDIPWFNVLGNHDYPVYGNLSSKNVGVIRPNMGFQTVGSRYNFINMHGKGFYADHLVYFSPYNAPDLQTAMYWDSVYNGFDGRGKYFAGEDNLFVELESPLPEVDFGNLEEDFKYLKDKIEYEHRDGKFSLIFKKGVMFKKEKDTLIGISKNPSYKKTVEILFEKGKYNAREGEPCKDCPGYYYFEALQPKNGEPGVLFVVLDTTTRDFRFAKGTVYRHNEVDGPPDEGKKLEQINWLRGILKDYSQKGNWMVLVFGHHQLREEGFSDKSYEKLLDIFNDPKNNVIAYFCGHTHKHEVKYRKNDNNPKTFGFWEITTDSIMEYPKRGSLVTIRHKEEYIWEMVLQSFWPYFLEELDDNAPNLLRNAKKCFAAAKEDKGGKKLVKRYQNLDQKHHDVVLKFVYPKTK